MTGIIASDRKSYISRNKNKLWFKLELENRLENYIEQRYIKDNIGFYELAQELNCSEDKLIQILSILNITKDRKLVSIRSTNTRRKKHNGNYTSEQGLIKIKDTLNTPINRAKAKDAMREKYGVEYTLQSVELRSKVEQSTLKNRGFTNPFKDKNWQYEHHKPGNESWSHEARITRANNRLLNPDKFKPANWSVETFYILGNKDNFTKWLDTLNPNDRTYNYIANLLNVSYDVIRKKYSDWNLHESYPLRKYRSTPEIEITHNIESYYSGVVILNTRRIIHPYELDLYLPEINLAIEFNGNYYHNKLDTTREDFKTKLCEDKNIQLLHIWEDDWNKDKQMILIQIKQLISQKLEVKSY